MIKVVHRGNFRKSERFFKRMLRRNYRNILENYGENGVQLLRDATPIDSGETANSWAYHIEEENGIIRIVWTNSNVVDGECIVLLLIYGHGLQNGGYVEGNNFVDPAIRPVMRSMARRAWREVTK